MNEVQDGETSPDELRGLLDSAGLDPAGLSLMMGLHRSTPYKWLAGEAPAPLWLLAHLRIVSRMRLLCRTAFGAHQGNGVPSQLPARLQHLSHLRRPSTTGDEIGEYIPTEGMGAAILPAMDDEPSGMTPDAFRAALQAIHWRQADFARHVGCDDKTASRWSIGKTAIPKWVAVHLELLRQIQELQQFLQPKRERKARGSPE